jgi:hypothetical protein
MLSLRLADASSLDFAGAWEGTANKQPAVKLLILDDGSVIRGEVTIYTQVQDSDGKWRVVNKLTAPLRSPIAKGNTLTFLAQYYKSRGSRNLTEFKYQMVLNGPKSAVFRCLGPGHKAPPVELLCQTCGVDAPQAGTDNSRNPAEHLQWWDVRRRVRDPHFTPEVIDGYRKSRAEICFQR